MSPRRWLGVVVLGLTVGLSFYALRPTATSDLAYRLSWLAMLFAVVGTVAALRSRIVHIVGASEIGIIERAGRFHDTATPGLVLLLPFIENLRTLPLHEQSYECDEPHVLTLEGIPIGIKMLIRYRLDWTDTDAVQRAAYDVADWQEAVKKEARAAVHQRIGRMTIDEVLEHWSDLGEAIRLGVQATAANWGVTIPGIQLFDVQMPERIRIALEDERRAQIEARATEFRAGGEVERIRQIAEVLGEGGGLDAVMTERYIQAMESMSTNPSSHIVLPAEFLRRLEALARAPDERPQPADGQPAQGAKSEAPAERAEPDARDPD